LALSGRSQSSNPPTRSHTDRLTNKLAVWYRPPSKVTQRARSKGVRRADGSAVTAPCTRSAWSIADSPFRNQSPDVKKATTLTAIIASSPGRPTPEALVSSPAREPRRPRDQRRGPDARPG